MNTKLLIFGLILMLSCKKAEVKPLEQPITQNEPTPVVKTPKLFNLQGNYSEMYCLLNSKGIKPPFNVYTSDTVKVFAKVPSTYPYQATNLEVYVYIDSKLFDSKTNVHTFEKTYIIE